MRLFRKKKYFREYGLNLSYEIETYKHVGHDYGNRKTANLGWILNFRRWRRKRRNQKRNKYAQCDRYSEWKSHVEEILTVGENDYNNMLHFLYEKKNAAERKFESTKGLLIPLYMAIIALISSLSEVDKLGTGKKFVFFGVMIVGIIDITVYALHDAAKEISFYKDFIEIAEKKEPQVEVFEERKDL